MTSKAPHHGDPRHYEEDIAKLKAEVTQLREERDRWKARAINLAEAVMDQVVEPWLKARAGQKRPWPHGDWTEHGGRTNSSALFLALAAEVGRLIRDDAHTLMRGGYRNTGLLVMAQLAHVHGLAPKDYGRTMIEDDERGTPRT